MPWPVTSLSWPGPRLKVSKITNDTYLVAGVTDHIVPWRSNYRTTQLFQGERRFVLTPGGHIAGIINPPRPEAKFWANERAPRRPRPMAVRRRRSSKHVVGRTGLSGYALARAPCAYRQRWAMPSTRS